MDYIIKDWEKKMSAFESSVEKDLKEIRKCKADIQQMRNEIQREKQGNYFYRLSSIYSKRLELAESFIKARSAINLRDIHFMRGLRGQFSDRGFDISHMDSTNQHFLIELAPMTHESDFWNGTFIPFNDERYYHKLYDSQVETLASEDGDSIYRVRLTKNSEPSLHLPYLEGTLYVSQKNWRLLRFEGDIHVQSLLMMMVFDYAQWADGRYFYDDKTYAAFVLGFVRLHPGETVHVYLATNDPAVTEEAFCRTL